MPVRSCRQHEQLRLPVRRLRLAAHPDSLPAGEAMAWIAAWQLPIIIGLQWFYILLFPTGRLPSRSWRALVSLIVAFVVVGVILSAFSTDANLGSLDPIKNPLGVGAFAAVAIAVLLRLRQAVGVERQQIKWFAYAAAIFAVASILNIAVVAIDVPLWVEWTNAVIFPVAGTAIPIAIGKAILRHRLYDIDVLINRTLVYGALSAALWRFTSGASSFAEGLRRPCRESGLPWQSWRPPSL